MASLKDLIVHGTSKFISNIFGNIIHANKFITNGGTSSQFVKGDGTLDDSTYLTSATTPQYTITKLTTAETGYIASYELKKDGTKVGDTINIPKDYLVKSGTIETVTTSNVPYQGAVVGDKYLDFVVNTYDTSVGSGTTSHIYISVKDLVDVYTGGNGIDISASNIVSVKIDSNNANGLSVGENGLSLSTATTTSSGAMSSADKLKLDGIASGAEVNVQSDWNQTNTSADDYIKNKPNIGSLKTDNTSAQTTSSSESFTGNINLHKISKTGSYNDLNDKPTIPSSGDFVTSLGTSGKNVTWTKNGITNNLTVPYATNADTATKLGSSTVGASNRPIYLNAGVPTVTNPGESFLSWGGKNFSASYGCIDAAMVSELGACRTMFAYAAGIVIEYSVDSGATWLDYGATNVEKVGLFSSGKAFTIGKATKETASAANMLRVTLHTGAAGLYTSLNKFVIFVSTNGSTGTYCTIRCRTQQNYEDNIDTWKILANQVSVEGWPGYNVINFPSTTTYGNTKSSQYGEWQFIFGCTGHNNASYAGLNVSKIYGFGGVGWSTPSTMASTGHLYAFDPSKNAIFPATIKATQIIKTDGTSSQFLKADGSVDSTSYATSASLESYLSLAGGTMIGSIRRDYDSESDVPVLNILSANQDIWLWRVKDKATGAATATSSVYGFGLKYLGTGIGNNNSIALYSDNQTGTQVKAVEMKQDGTIEFSKSITAPTATAGTNTTQIATTAFVNTAISNKADKVSGATSGNFAGLDASGNLTDSGSKASDFATSTHTHGNITNTGELQTNDITIASGDKLVVTDTSNSGKIARTSISFDGTTTNTALTPKGTFERFLQSSDLNTYWANQQLTSEAVYNTEPEFKTVTINGSTNSSTASTENGVLLYDTEEKCIKFMFN